MRGNTTGLGRGMALDLLARSAMLLALRVIQRRVAKKEVSMDEVFPVLAGIALGLASYAVRPMWLKATLVGILGMGLGALASWISGELALSRIYLLIDTAQVLVAAILSGVLAGFWLRRRARSLAR